MNGALSAVLRFLLVVKEWLAHRLDFWALYRTAGLDFSFRASAAARYLFSFYMSSRTPERHLRLFLACTVRPLSVLHLESCPTFRDITGGNEPADESVRQFAHVEHHHRGVP